MNKLRPILFWLHLVAGLVAGVVIAIMSFTGAALAFEKEIIAWAERDLRRVAPPADGKRLPLDDLLARAREQRPDARPTGFTVSADPAATVLLSLGRTNAFHVNPYTGTVQPQGAASVRDFMRAMIEWHRYLSAQGDRRPVGKAVTGAGNVVFLVLVLTGLLLWWPRNWTQSALRTVALLNVTLRGKARDFNWHNAIGIWSAPVLLVVTLTAMPISYRWASDLIFKLTGTEAPPAGAGFGMSGLPVEVPLPPPGTKPLGYDALLAAAQTHLPGWEQITFRLGGGPSPTTNAVPVRSENTSAHASHKEGRGGPSAVAVTIKQRGGWPLFAATQLNLDPYTGTILKQETFSDQNLGRQVRSWTRFLHTGEALGLVGQALAGLACVGALFLVWTGLALSWRRFFGRKPGPPDDAIAIATGPDKTNSQGLA